MAQTWHGEEVAEMQGEYSYDEESQALLEIESMNFKKVKVRFSNLKMPEGEETIEKYVAAEVAYDSDDCTSKEFRDILGEHKERIEELKRTISNKEIYPMVVGEDNVIIDGRHRWFAYKSLGYDGLITIFKETMKD